MNKIENLSVWACDHGAEKSGDVDFDDFSKFGFGGKIERSIRSGEILLSIPLSISIDPEIAKSKSTFSISQSNPFTEEEQSNNFNSDVIILYCFLVQEKRKRDTSFFFPYINSLPTDFSNFPISHFRYSTEKSNEDINKTKIFVEIEPKIKHLLEGTNLLRSLTHLFTKIVRLHIFIIGHEDDEFLRSVEMKELIWAFTIIWSRAFPLYHQENVATPTLLPFIDILNHKSGMKREFRVENDSFYLVTKEDISVNNNDKKPVQIFNNYGQKSNDSFLQSYGFVIENNPDDSFYLQLGGATKNNNSSSGGGVYLQKIDVNISPFHSLLQKLQIMINKRNNHFSISDCEFISIEEISLETMSILYELLSNKISDLLPLQTTITTERNKKKIIYYESGSFEWMCCIYKSGQLEILQQSISKLKEYQNLKIQSLSKTTKIYRTNNLNKYLISSSTTTTTNNNKKRFQNEFVLYKDLICCPPEELDFLNYLNDDELKLTIYILILLNNNNTKKKFKNFFEDVIKINEISKPLILLLLSLQEEEKNNYNKDIDIFDMVIGIKEELFEIFLKIKKDHDVQINKLLLKKEKESTTTTTTTKKEEKLLFNFKNFLFCYSIVERFSKRSFQYLYIIPKISFFEAYNHNHNQQFLLFSSFDKNSKILRLYNPINNINDDKYIYYYYYCLFQPNISILEFFRKYGVIKSNDENNEIPIDINYFQQQQEKIRTIRIYISLIKNKHQKLKKLKLILEKIYKEYLEQEDQNIVYNIMENLINQYLNMIPRDNDNDDNNLFSILRRLKINILQKNLELIKKKEI